MHIFLTGEIQVGKSTILRRWTEANPSLRIGGFRTVASGDCSSVHIVPARGEPILSDANRVLLRRGKFPDRELCPFPEIFDTVGADLLKSDHSYDALLMDELGFCENAALRFQAAVRTWLDGDTPVLGVVRNRPGVLPDLVRSHPRVRVLTVTPENRDGILKELLAWKI